MPAPASRRLRPALAAAALALASVVGAAGDARATTLIRMDLPALVGSSDRVVHARVIGSAVSWNDDHTLIHTDTTFQILGEAKGTGPATLTLRLLGGRIDPFELREEGSPGFASGEEVVLFTHVRPDGLSGLVGFCQGVMRVRPEPQTGEVYAIGEVPLGVDFVQGPRLTEVRPSPMRARLASLMDEVRRIVGGAAAGPILSTSPEMDMLEPDGGTP